MPAASFDPRGLVMAAGTLGIAAYFAWRQHAERHARDDDQSVDDADYYARRDRRRLLGTSNLGLIGLGILAASLVQPRSHPVIFLSLWLMVGVLLCVSTAVACLDIIANNRYAKRHRLLLIEERRALLEEELRRHIAGQNGHGDLLT